MEQELNIYEKLSIVKSEIGVLSKTATNPFFKSKYLELGGILSALEPLLEKNGLLLLQAIEDGKVVTTIHNLTNTDEVVTSEMPLPDIVDPQKLGIAITYYRRYTLQSLLALQAEDNDGNGTKPKVKKALGSETFDRVVEKINNREADDNGYLITAQYVRDNFTLKPAQESALLLLNLEQ